MFKIILASKSEVRKKILEENQIKCKVIHSNVDEEPVKQSMLSNGERPDTISKNLAELKANKVSSSFVNELVLGADSVIDLDGNLISKPVDRKEAFIILKKLNGKKHKLISSVCISFNGSMIWNYTEKAELLMKELTNDEISSYLSKISDKDLYSYNVYQIEGPGRALFKSINGDENTIMGLPIEKIKTYLIEREC